MARASGSGRRGLSLRNYFWRSLLAIELFTALLASFFAFPALASAAPSETFTSSPKQGPVGAVIEVSGSSFAQPDGTRVQFGYSTDFSNCKLAPNSQMGVVQNQAFHGWLVWPAGTGIGNFEVCASVLGSNAPFMVGNYQVLSATPPHISVTPATLEAGQHATVSGTNFLPAGTNVELVWQTEQGQQGLVLGTVTADASGAFTRTFVAPAQASTGRYRVVATAGGGQPSTLSAATTFMVNGITIVAVPTPTAQPDLTPGQEVPTIPATTIPRSIATGQTISTTPGDKTIGKAGVLLPLALGGLLLIIAALVGGILVVRRQRALALAKISNNAAWTREANVPAVTPPPVADFAEDPIYQANTVPLVASRATRPEPIEARAPDIQQDRRIIPFDSELIEAMQQAQVGLFAIPRPPLEEKVLS